MKITKKFLEKLIKEEVKKAARLNEGIGVGIDIKGLPFWPVVEKLNSIMTMAKDAVSNPKAQSAEQLDLDPTTLGMFKDILENAEKARAIIEKYSKEHP